MASRSGGRRAGRGAGGAVGGAAHPSANKRSSDSTQVTAADIEARLIGLLARREHGRTELIQKLTARGLERADVARAIDDLAARGLQSDQRFASMMVRQRIERGYGALRIRAELTQRGIESSIIDAALAEAGSEADDPVTRATELLRRRLGRQVSRAGDSAPGDDPRSRAKWLRFLAQRGFDFATAQQALARALEDAEDD